MSFQITICAIAKLANHKPEQQLINHYRKIIPFDCHIKEISASKDKNTYLRKKQEADYINAYLHQQSHQQHMIVLDEHGKDCTSQEWATMLRLWQENQQQTTIIIGGADGLDISLYNKAQQKISFGKVTLPHAFVRVILLEQLYRAHTILHRHPYHRP